MVLLGELPGRLSLGRVIAPKNLGALSDGKRRAENTRCRELFTQSGFGAAPAARNLTGAGEVSMNSAHVCG